MCFLHNDRYCVLYCLHTGLDCVLLHLSNEEQKTCASLQEVLDTPLQAVL